MEKLKAFSDNNLNIPEITVHIVYEIVQNLLVKEKMPVTRVFSFSCKVFKNLISGGSLKLEIM